MYGFESRGHGHARELTWLELVTFGGKLYVRQLRQLPEVLVLPLGGMAWSEQERCIVAPPQIMPGEWALGERFSNSPTANPSGSVLRLLQLEKTSLDCVASPEDLIDRKCTMKGKSILESYGESRRTEVACTDGTVTFNMLLLESP